VVPVPCWIAFFRATLASATPSRCAYACRLGSVPLTRRQLGSRPVFNPLDRLSLFCNKSLSQ
jgi:hypothetical protein